MSSEIARIREQISLEYKAAQRALYSPAMVARHDFINKRMENVGELHEKLSRHIGMEEATKTSLTSRLKLLESEERCLTRVGKFPRLHFP